MNTTELLAIFQSFTKEDWQQFDELKAQKTTPAQEEIEEQERKQEEQRINNMVQYLTTTLALYSIRYSDDYDSMIYQYIFNPKDLKEYV